MLLIGSRALKFLCPGIILNRNIVDWDIICTKDEFKSLVREIMKIENRLIEVSFEEGTNKAFAKFISKETNKLEVIEVSMTDVEGGLQQSDLELWTYAGIIRGSMKCLGVNLSIRIPSLEILYLIKLSHRYKKNSAQFLKTMQDIALFEKEFDFNANHISSDKWMNSVLIEREKLTYNYAHPKLNTTKEEFFTDSVPYKWDHDSIHEAVKMLDKPAYKYYIIENEQVLCSKEKFNALPEIVKLYGVLEESYVLALERAIIPFNTKPERSFEIALEKVCTSITSGWFREFAYNNYNEVKSLYHSSFVDKFYDALEHGRIKLFNGIKVY